MAASIGSVCAEFRPQLGAGNLNSRNQRVDTYTPSGLLDTRDDRNDNSTRLFADFNQANAFSRSQRIQTFNAADVPVSDIFV